MGCGSSNTTTQTIIIKASQFYPEIKKDFNKDYKVTEMLGKGFFVFSNFL